VSGEFEDLQDLLDRMERLPYAERGDLISLVRGWLAAQNRPEELDPDSLPSQFGMIGGSAAMHKVFDLIGRIVRTDIPVLVLGESGTGKELIAKALHGFGARRRKELVSVNCAAIPAELLEAEIFGHVKGSFTGAHKDRIGYAEAAEGGTLFLDEIGEIQLDLQAKLLRFLQDGEIRPVGSNKTKRVDVRIVAATNRDLQERVRAGAFREDLYYRLAVMPLELPALRERAEDIPHLVRFLLVQQAAEGLPSAGIDDAAVSALQGYSWPGNIRQLQNELVRAATFATDGTIGVTDLTDDIQSASA
jgi:two-component system nitrogen regulation response regulator GlnG